LRAHLCAHYGAQTQRKKQCYPEISALHGRRLTTADIGGNKAFDPRGIKVSVILYILFFAFASN
jgi:hypothetical protein